MESESVRLIYDAFMPEDLVELLERSGLRELLEAIDSSLYYFNRRTEITFPDIMRVEVRRRANKVYEVYGKWSCTEKEVQESVWDSDKPLPKVGDRVESLLCSGKARVHAYFYPVTSEGVRKTSLICLYDDQFPASERAEKRFEIELKRARHHKKNYKYRLKFATLISRELA